MSTVGDQLYQFGGIPVGGRFTTGKNYFVNSNDSSSGNTGKKPGSALPTINYGLDKVTENNGDIIYCMPGHAETIGKSALDVDGVEIIGLGSGKLRPSLTTATADDCVDITGDNVRFENFQFAAPGIDAVTSYLNINGPGAIIRDIYAADCSGSTTYNVVDAIVITALGDDCLLENIVLFNKTAAVNSFLHFEGAASNVVVKNFRAFGDVAVGGIIDTAKIDYLILEDVNVGVVGAYPACSLGSNPEGMAKNCHFSAGGGTTAAAGALGNLMRICEVFVQNDVDGSTSAYRYPAFDAAS